MSDRMLDANQSPLAPSQEQLKKKKHTLPRALGDDDALEEERVVARPTTAAATAAASGTPLHVAADIAKPVPRRLRHAHLHGRGQRLARLGPVRSHVPGAAHKHALLVQDLVAAIDKRCEESGGWGEGRGRCEEAGGC